MEEHIHKLKRHRNVLYGIVVLLLALQIATFIGVTLKTSRIIADQENIQNSLNGALEDFRKENLASINEITKTVAQNQVDLELQIENIKAGTEQDFSEVIDDVIKGVVSIRTDRSVGTGFLVSPSGYFVTNAHVIEGAETITASTYTGQDYEAVVVGEDTFTDIALLKIPGVFDYIDLENSDNVQTGEKVIAIGNPLGLSFTVTEGIVSAVDREGPNGLASYVQTDVTLNPGNSGGPLINRDGKVIGVNNFKIGGAESLGFALESDVVKEKVNEFANQTLIE